MRTFSQKENHAQKRGSSSLARSHMAAPRPAHLDHPILYLQRTLGNQAVLRMLQTVAESAEEPGKLMVAASPRFGHDFSRIPVHPPGGPIQPKLAINRPGDEYEQEADRISEQVMRMPEPQLQRACACGGGCPKCQREQPGQAHGRLQTKRVQVGDTGQTAAPSIVREVIAGPGQPLDPVTRSFMEPCFGNDFAHVRVHTGPDAAESARQIGARAYTVGGHIVFGEGEYAPASNAGRMLLTHELAHVLQQDVGRMAGAVQRREVDDRSCAGLTDIESDVNAEVTSQIAAARAEIAAHSPSGSPIDVKALATKVWELLGKDIISPIEKFVEDLPPSKRNSPPADLAGTKYSGIHPFLSAHDWVASSANVHGVCIGADKLGHFFDLGFRYWMASLVPGVTTARIESLGSGTEMTLAGLGITGVYSNADLEANRKGFQFYKNLEANPSGLTFAIKDYITDQWNEQVNPSFYRSDIAEDVWSNLLTGLWRGIIGPSTKADVQFNLTATGSSVNGTYELPAGSAHPDKGKITGGTITQVTTTVSGDVSLDPSVAPNLASKTPVSGVKIEFDWERGKSSGKGVLNSVKEQTLLGTWGRGASRTDGGVLQLKKV
jgi:Domain of unknown function (DUF4157)